MQADLPLLDPLVRGVAVGAAAVLGLAVGGGGPSRSVRISGALLSLGVIAWLIGESVYVKQLVGDGPTVIELALPVAGFFWLFVRTVFDDAPIRPLMAFPAVVLLVLGLSMLALGDGFGNGPWSLYNLGNGVVVIHATTIVVRGWRGDLIEGRRKLRGLGMAFGAVFAFASVAIGFGARFDPNGPWINFTVGRFYGGLMFAVVMLTATAIFLQARASVFGAPRRATTAMDSKTEAAERLVLERLNAFMGEGGWRREGLTIGAVAEALGEPEHRVRRLINQRLGHRNFADFVNGYRTDAARERLSDPSDARTTVATIAFDVGYGSLGPFNRAFRAVTGETPTEWRRRALAQGSSNLKDVG